MIMQKLRFETELEAPKEKVWDVLWEDSTYREWTSVFSEGSHAVSDWKEGSKVLFLSGSGDGMYSRIAKRIPGEFMSFQHIGEISEGKVQPMTDESKEWSGAMENYSLSETNGKTTIEVEIDMMEDHVDYFRKTFPIALEKVKEIAER